MASVVYRQAEGQIEWVGNVREVKIEVAANVSAA
jgi:hypothetical protein